MFPVNRPEPDQHQMLAFLCEALNRSDQQFRYNNDALARRGDHVYCQQGYVDVRVDTTNGSHTGRVFYANAYEHVLLLHPTSVTDPDQSLPTEVTYVRADAIETMQVTFTFEGTFEVAIARDDLNAALDHIHEVATSHDTSERENTSAGIDAALKTLGQNASSSLRESMDLAERDWRRFLGRTLSKEAFGSGVVSGGWYLPAETDKDDSPHYGEIAFQHTHQGMPTDYLYAETRERVRDALMERVSPF